MVVPQPEPHSVCGALVHMPLLQSSVSALVVKVHATFFISFEYSSKLFVCQKKSFYNAMKNLQILNDANLHNLKDDTIYL